MDTAAISSPRLAVLIDAENVPRNCVKSVLEEVAIYGTPTIKRIYGDWTNHQLDGWKTPLLENAITPIQQYSYTTGKNSSDSAMIIDAMDILYTEKTDGFVIVSSDSDFTRLAIRLREAGQRVIGIGERKTPPAFITACDKFTYIEIIRKNFEDAHAAAEPTVPAATDTAAISAPRPIPRDASDKDAPTKRDRSRSAEKSDKTEKNEKAVEKPVEKSVKVEKITKSVTKLIADSISDLSDESPDVFMGELGNLLRRKKPDFDHRNYGYKSLTAMIQAIDRFDIDFRKTTDPNIKHPYVKDKDA
ncbi:MAG: NYN domain-containing protein [Oscillospiraceae bacterium]|jgi:hypothetical protein|nr:NYN domain-containing protein [Oscillospiraceae bacterium]